MDPVERMFRHLVRTVRASFPQYLSRPFEVAELYQNVLPYRHHRRELGLETNDDYELALTGLLSGAGGYLIVDDRMRERLQRELESPNPDTGAFRDFATAQVALSPEAVRRVETAAGAEPAAAPPAQRPGAGPSGSVTAVGGPTGPRAAPAPVARPGDAPPPQARVTPPAAVRHSLGMVTGAGSRCRYCGGTLPADRRVVFCPHCGQNLNTINCVACGTELELGWKFCTTCGKPAPAASG